jgi:hypothetical protein
LNLNIAQALVEPAESDIDPSRDPCLHTRTEQTNNKEKANKQTHTQGNNKNNEGKQQKNKIQMENTQSVTT